MKSGKKIMLGIINFDLTNTFGSFKQKYGDYFRVWIGLDLNIFVSDPDDIKTLLKSPKTSIKGPQYKYIREFCGNGLQFNSIFGCNGVCPSGQFCQRQGQSWRISRKTVLPNYGKKALENYDEVINAEAYETVKRLNGKVGGKAFDIYDDIVLGTTYTVCRTLMGLTREQTLNLPHMNTTFLHDAHEMKVLETMDQRKLEDILSAEENKKCNTELSVIDRLLLSNQIPSHEEFVKQWFTVFTASQEATAKITSYTLLMMAYHPECQEKVYAEIKTVFGDNVKDVTEEDLKQMPYLDMVFKEVNRLFPIGVMLQRTIAEDITISKGLTLPAGSSLVIPIYHIHRDKRFWTNPDAFDPERFSPENVRLRPPSCYIPFSLGPMDCMGRYFAHKLVKTLAVRILQQFRLTSPEKYEDLRLVMAVSCASVNGYPVQLHLRNRLKMS